VRASEAKSNKLLLKGGRVVDPANGRDGEFDILVEDGRIARVGKSLPADGAEVLALKPGWIVAPGLIDIHVHRPRGGRRRGIYRGRVHAEH
jgi:dihydroorotase